MTDSKPSAGTGPDDMVVPVQPPYYRYLSGLAPFRNLLQTRQTALMVALGDSNTDNTHFTQGGKQWPELLHADLKQRYQTLRLGLYNAGISGDCVVRAVDRFETDVARFHPQLVFIVLGSNDANRLSDEQFATGLDRLIERSRALGATVFLRTPPPIWQRDRGFDRIWPDDHKLAAKVALIRAAADRWQIPFVDTYGLWREAGEAGRLRMRELMTDEVHLNAAGHRLVARQLLAVFDSPIG